MADDSAALEELIDAAAAAVDADARFQEARERLSTAFFVAFSERNVSAAELARAVGVSRAAVAEWVHGRSVPKRPHEVANALRDFPLHARNPPC